MLLHLGHRLVQMCLRLLRAELWADARPHPRGRDRRGGTRLHEEVVLAGGTIEVGRLVRAAEDNLREWLAASTPELPPDSVTGRLASLSRTLAGMLENRSTARRRSLSALIESRCAEEVKAMDAILTELERSIRDALDDTQRWEQASLFEIEAEREQLRTDREALHRRLESIPATREQETAALRRRYADPQARWFSAAVTFLVPASIAKGGSA